MFNLQEVDIAIRSVTITAPRATVSDYSVAYYETGVGFIAHIPRELSKWASLLRPYKLAVWLSILVALICSGPVGWWISQHTARRQSRRKLNNKSLNLERAYELTLKIFVNQGNQSKFQALIKNFKNISLNLSTAPIPNDIMLLTKKLFQQMTLLVK